VLHLKGGGQPRRVAKEFGGEIFGVIVGVLARESGGGTHGEVAEAEPELRIRAGKAAALTVGEAMVAAGRFAIGFDNRRQESGTVRDGVHCFLGGGYPHMKMHECQNKGVTRKAFRKCKKRKE